MSRSGMAMEIGFDRTPARARPPVLSSGTIGSRPSAPSANRGISRPTGLSSASSSSKEYRTGQQVKVKKAPGQPGLLYNDGVITNKNMDGTYDIKYDSGKSEFSVAAARIQLSGGTSGADSGSENESKSGDRPSSSMSSGMGSGFRLGSKIEFKERISGPYVAGKIVSVNKNNTFDILLENGKEVREVMESKLKPASSLNSSMDLAGSSSLTSLAHDDFGLGSSGGGGSASSNAALSIGDRVQAKKNDGIKWYPATITSKRPLDHYDLIYDDDNTKELRVPRSRIRPFNSSNLDSEFAPRSATKKTRLSEGMKVEANYRGKGKYYSGRIKRDRMDGTFDIDYDDGEQETRVDESMIRSLEVSSSLARSPAKARIVEGAKVEANYRGKGKYYSGRVKRDRGDGTYDIDYDDGEQETRVAAELIRVIGGGGLARSNSPPASRSKVRLSEGMKVEANYRGKGKYYSGRIKRDRGDGTFDIDYDDGEQETRVDESLIRAVESSSLARSPVKKTLIAEGSKVEANYRGKGKYYSGRVKRDRGDGTYDIDYDDGEQETRVPKEWVRVVGGGGLARSNSPPARKARLSEGMKVEANYRGKGKYYSGRIKRDRGDGTFDIDYDDGEQETRVDESMIRALESSSLARSPAKARIVEGAKVEANYRGKGKYYSGRVKRDRGDGTFDIDYDDGEQETRVPKEWVRAVGGGLTLSNSPPASRGKVRLTEGMKVEANYRGKGKYYSGRIKRDRGDGTFDIDYDDGEQETRVDESMIRALESSSLARSPAKARIVEGAKVEANYRGKGKYYSGRVKRDRGDGTYDIDYDDGEQETRVAAELIRVIGGGGLARSNSPPARKARLSEGMKVEANYRGKGKYYPGRVKRDRGDGTFDIDYDDGEQETRVDESLIRSLEVSSSLARSPAKSRIVEGAKVEANYRGKGKYYSGRVKRDRGDGTYDIDYDDGEQETRVAAELIRPVGGGGLAHSNSPPASRGKVRLNEGMKVEANYRGKGKYYSGRIKRDRGDGTYDIDYDDGEQETRVDESLIRAVESSSLARSPVKKTLIAEGSKVEANYRGKGKYYSGRVKRDRGDGTYDIDYDDGEQETRVPKEWVRAVGGGGLARSNSPPARKARLSEGMKVEANYRGKGKYYSGRIKRDRGDGTFDIDYDDGEQETRVDESLIRSLEVSSSLARSPKRGNAIVEGAKVEANYRGKGKYYSGRVKRDRGDGTFDIDYDDGEQETRVDESLIRVLGGGRSSSPSGKGKLSVGAKVEANYRGKGKYFSGKIARDRGDGTFDIDYDDGESESRVDENLIRLVGRSGRSASPAARGKGRLVEGAKVEANYRGKGKYYPGKIKRDRGDGTFDIDYDDGEQETRVDESLIRLIGGGRSASPPRGKARIVEGAKVEANYRGKGKYYSGRVKRDRGDGTYDIDYDDGEQETRVDESLIRVVGGGRSSSPSGKGKLSVGAKVEANYRGKGKYFSGKIARDRGDGTFDIDYDDGESESRVDEKLIRLVGGRGGRSASPPARKARLEEGAKVEANYRGKGKYYSGRIKRDRGDGTFDIDYDDGEQETRVDESLIRLIGGSGRSSSPGGKGKLREGAKVEANYRGKGKYYPGKIKRDRGDGTFDIDYDDGEQETRVDESLIRVIGGGRSSSPVGRGKLVEGAKVEANYRGKGKYYSGCIKRDRGDGTFDIDYDDGEQETRVDESLIRVIGGGRSSSPGGKGKLSVGAKVEANYRGKGKYFSGKIARDRGDGTFDIDYDDGESESRVDEKLIRLVGGRGGRSASPPSRSKGRLEEGAKVEANYRGKGKYYPGKIKRDRGDGTFDIDYDDGEQETRVDESLIRLLSRSGRSSSPSGKGKLSVGAKVEADYRGRGKYFSGKIARDRGDGTFDIDYDDGESESRVDEKLIRLVGGRGGRSASPPSRSKGRLEEGAKVEANYRGKGKYYPGKIKRDRGDGTFDIDYDDGEQETRVDESLIRLLGGRGRSSSPNGKGKLSVGAKVEANYRGRGKYFSGKIARDRGDGTFDIDYDDGESESRVDEKLIRLVGGRGGRSASPPSRSKGRLEEGAKVEANYRGKGKYYPGKIKRDRGDGTFDIDYDDGEQETRVDESLIRLIGGRGRSSSPAGRGKLSVGTKVEANYRGKGKFFSGKIARDRGDGTFDIDYDDGESESRVDEKLIRIIGGGRGRSSSPPSRSKGRLEEGAKVEANYRGKGKYYPGKIRRDRRDGTFDIDYDDGESESRVEENMIRLLPTKGGRSRSRSRSRSPEDKLTEGEKVEANYRGKGKYYPGKVRRVHLDDTFDIDYDDGESETKVPRNLIRVVGGGGKRGSSSNGRSSFSVGDEVEANYRNRGRWLVGEIVRENRDNTYDIDYENGDKEKNVESDLIRRTSGKKGEGKRGDRTILIPPKMRQSIQTVCAKYNNKNVDNNCNVVFQQYAAAEDSGHNKRDLNPTSGLVTKKEFKVALRNIFQGTLSRSDSAKDLDDWLNDDEVELVMSCISYETGSAASINMIHYEDFLAFALDPPAGGRHDRPDANAQSLLDEVHVKLTKEVFTKGKYKQKDIVKLFATSKTFGKGYVRTSEFEKVLQKLCSKLSLSEVKALTEHYDANREGVIDVQLFMYWLMLGHPNVVSDVLVKVATQLSLLSVRAIEDGLGKFTSGRGDKSTLTPQDFVEGCQQGLGLMLTVAEIGVFYDAIDVDHKDVITVEQVLSWLEKKSDKNAGRKRDSSHHSATRGNGSVELISKDVRDDLVEKVKAYFSSIRVRGRTHREISSKQVSLGKMLLLQINENHSNLANYTMTKKQFRKILAALDGGDDGEGKGRALRESDENLLFEAFDNSGNNTIDIHDLLTYLYDIHLENENDDATVAVQDTFMKKRVSSKEFYRLLSKSEVKNTGYCDYSNYEAAVKKCCGQNNITSDQMGDLLRFLDPSKDGIIDILYSSSFIQLCYDAYATQKAENKLKHCLKVMRLKNIPYKREVIDKTSSGSRSTDNSVVAVREVVDIFYGFSLPLLRFEIEAVVSKFAGGSKEVNVDKFLEMLENEAAAGPVAGITSLLKGLTKSTGSDGFGKGLFKKICKLRANVEDRVDFRTALFEKDAELVGHITSRDFQRILDNKLDLSDAESALLIENLTFNDGFHKHDIDYSYMLLLIHEPIAHSPLAAGAAIINKMIRGSDLVSLRRLLALLFRNCAAFDTRATGYVTPKEMNKTMKDECHHVDPKFINQLMKAFTDPSKTSSGSRHHRGSAEDEEDASCIMYPEMIAFLGCCYLGNVMNKLYHVELIRAKQGYNLKNILTKYVSKRGNKLDIHHFTEQLHLLGIYLTETAVSIIFSFYGKNKHGLLDVNAFAEGITHHNGLESNPEGGGGGGGAGGLSHSFNKDDITPFKPEGNSTAQTCEIAQKILADYDAKLIRALQIAYDILDIHNHNEIPCSELERIMCSIGYQQVPFHELAELASKIDTQNSGMLRFNQYMTVMIPYLRSKYDSAGQTSIAKLKFLFDKFDSSGDGILQPYELKHCLKLLSKHVNQEEVDALVTYLDVDEDGDISWTEFKRVYDVIHDISAMNKLDVTVRTALRKIQYSGLPNPYEYLTMYVGLPSNYRLSILSELEKTSPGNGMKEIICKQYRPSQLANYNPKTNDNSGVNGTLVPDLQFEAQIVRVTGVPSEDVLRREDIISREVKFSICQTNKPPRDGEPGNPPNFLGNITALHAHIHPSYLDKWQIANKEEMDPDKSCFIKCNSNQVYDEAHPPPAPYGPNDELFLFVELVVAMKIDKKKFKLTRKGIRKIKQLALQNSNSVQSQQLPPQQQQQNLSQQQQQGGANNKPVDPRQSTTSLGGNRNTGVASSTTSFMDNFRFGYSSTNTSVKEKSTSVKTSWFSKEDAKERRKSKKNKKGKKSKKGKKKRSHRGSDSDGSDSSDDDNSRKSGSGDDSSSSEEEDEEWIKDYHDAAGGGDDDESDSESDNDDKAGKKVIKKTQRDKDVIIVEMCCGWTLIPITDSLRNLTAPKKLRLNMFGGTPFSMVKINDNDVKLRAGAWQSLKRAFGFGVKSILEILITPTVPIIKPLPKNMSAATSAPGAPTNQVPDVLMTKTLPPNIVLPTSSVTVVGIYRKVLYNALMSNIINNEHNSMTIERVLPQSSANTIYYADAVLSSFPKIVADPAACRVLLLLWKKEFPDKEISGKSFKDWTNVETTNIRALQVFRSVVLQIWHAFSSPNAQPDKLNPIESLQAVTEREHCMMLTVGLKLPTTGLNGAPLTPATATMAQQMQQQQQLQRSQSEKAPGAPGTVVAASNVPGVAGTAASNVPARPVSFGFGRSPTQAQIQGQKIQEAQQKTLMQQQSGTIVGGVVVGGQQPKALAVGALNASNYANEDEFQLHTPFHSRELQWTTGRRLDI